MRKAPGVGETPDAQIDRIMCRSQKRGTGGWLDMEEKDMHRWDMARCRMWVYAANIGGSALGRVNCHCAGIARSGPGGKARHRVQRVC